MWSQFTAKAKKHIPRFLCSEESEFTILPFCFCLFVLFSLLFGIFSSALRKSLLQDLIFGLCSNVCADVFSRVWAGTFLSPEEGIGFPGASVTAGCELADQGAGNQSRVLCKNNSCLELLSHSSLWFHKGLFFKYSCLQFI